MNIHPAVVSEVRRYRRQVVGEFMDAHPGMFVPPLAALCWVDFLAQTEEVQGPERETVEKALGLFAQVFRQAQHAMLADAPMRLEEFMSTENFPDLEEVVVPDPVALLIVGGEDPADHTSEIVAFARTMSVFKFLVRAGAVPADFMYEAMCRGMDDLPGESVLKRALVDAIKQMIQYDMEMMLRNEVKMGALVH
ncbi:hypothetical protein B9Z45_15560 [Limnohabitans sp. 2KL-17]|uniref:hypothetical protein n=1 Tax=Limnohabitans sp. 2KL-17 TaxID=1100704 RepID=UPI000D370B96|nr:hypothetical protein [Limnohabitans sp. 2KL-17]PUE49834.1 hypothetical protein B9Z45_15560 [Limnohabitans sp. 2KL-17]